MYKGSCEHRRILHRSAETRVTDVLVAMGGKLAPTVEVDPSVNLATLGPRILGKFPKHVLRFFRSPRSRRAEAGRSLLQNAIGKSDWS